MDEVDAPVAAAGRQDGRVVDKHAVHGLALAQGVMQGSMVKGAQVAAEPYEGSLEGHYFCVFRGQR
jgi:hypothetical protein